jgi:pilus assembly protein CpaF
MDQRKLLQLQTQRGAKTSAFDSNIKTIEAVTNECRKYIEDNSERYRDLDPWQKKEAIKNIIIDYVMNTKPLVRGYMDEEGNPDILKLVDRLVDDITNYGILTAAMLDESINEIRCNGKELKVERHGKVGDLTDKDGNVVMFESPEQQEIVIRKLLGDVRMNPKYVIVNARTIEGYRVAGVHNNAIADDPTDVTAKKYHAFVLRKFKKSKLTIEDIVLSHALSDNMARFLNLVVQGGLTMLCVGPTASGKTSLLNALLKAAPPYRRFVLIQNPSEIDMRIKDATGRVINDVLHLEAIEKENPAPEDPTMENLMAHTLRLSPTSVVLGELRKNQEFGISMMILGAGHPIYTTLHAKHSKGAISRYLRAYMAYSNETIDTALPTVSDLIDIIVVQKFMNDGTRKVIQISEVCGVDPKNPREPLINDLYKFFPEGDPVYDSQGNIIHIPGVHRRVGKLSEETIERLKLEGIKTSRFDFLLKDPSDDEIETYTAQNIDRYGM